MGSPQYRQLVPCKIDSEFMRKLAKLLSNKSVFARFSKDEIWGLTKYMEGYIAEPGSAVFVEGGQAGYMCLVVEGELEVVKETSKGLSRKITDVCPGTSIGEMSIIDGLPHSATAIAEVQSTLAVLTTDSLMKMISEQPILGAKMLANIAELLSLRLRETNARLIDYLE